LDENGDRSFNVVDARKLSLKEKRCKGAKLILYFLYGLFYSLASLRENKALSKRH